MEEDEVGTSLFLFYLYLLYCGFSRRVADCYAWASFSTGHTKRDAQGRRTFPRGPQELLESNYLLCLALFTFLNAVRTLEVL